MAQITLQKIRIAPGGCKLIYTTEQQVPGTFPDDGPVTLKTTQELEANWEPHQDLKNAGAAFLDLLPSLVDLDPAKLDKCTVLGVNIKDLRGDDAAFMLTVKQITAAGKAFNYNTPLAFLAGIHKEDAIRQMLDELEAEAAAYITGKRGGGQLELPLETAPEVRKRRSGKAKEKSNTHTADLIGAEKIRQAAKQAL